MLFDYVFRPATALVAAIGIALPTLAQAQFQSSIEYKVGDARVELGLTEPVAIYSGSGHEARFIALSTGDDGSFEVKGTVMSENPELLFMSWPIAVAVLGEALEVPMDGTITRTIQGTDFTVFIETAETYDAPDGWVPTLLRGITPITIVDGIFIIDGIFLPPRLFDLTVAEITGVPLAGAGNLEIGFEERVVDQVLAWEVTVEDLEGNPVENAHLTNVIPRGTQDFLEDTIQTYVTDADGEVLIQAPSLAEGTRVYFVATNGPDEGGTLIMTPPSAR